MLRRSWLLALCGLLSAVMMGAIPVGLQAAPFLSKEASQLLNKGKRIQGNMSMPAVLKIMGQPRKQLLRDRYLWSGKNYQLVMDFRVFKSGPRLHSLGFTKLPDEAEQYDLSLRELLKKTESFVEQELSYADVVKSLGPPTQKINSKLMEYFWGAQEAVVIVVSANGKVESKDDYDQPQDYYNRARIPARL